MNYITIIGGTGFTGLCAVQTALNKGLKVRVLVRDPSKLPDNLKDKVEVVVGNVLNYDEVLNGVKGVDGVTVILGTRNDWSPTTDMSEGLKNIMKAMKETNIEIISVCLSALLFWDEDIVPAIFVDINEDHKRMFEALKTSGLKYIACLPPLIVDEPATEYKIQFDGSPGSVVSKNDLGRFLIESLSQPKYYEKVVGISSIAQIVFFCSEPKVLNYMDLRVVPLHKHPEYILTCCTLINSEWARSETARLRSLESSCDFLPVSLVLVQNNVAIGHLKLSRIPSKKDSCFVESVVIDKKLRSHGFGSYLMKQAEKYCLNNLQLNCIYLSTKGQEQFYAKLGYNQCEPVSLYGGDVLACSMPITSFNYGGPTPPPLPNTNVKLRITPKTYMCKQIQTVQ